MIDYHSDDHETDWPEEYNIPDTLGFSDDETYWHDGVEYTHEGLPVHLMMPVDRRGNGPLCDAAPLCGCCDDIAKWICWCGDRSCPGPQ